MSISQFRARVLALILSFTPLFSARAQNPPQPTPPTQPVQPAQPPNAQNPNAPNPDNNANPYPNTPPIPPIAGDQGDIPLTGAAEPPIGIVNGRSYILPSVDYYGQVDTNAYNTVGANSAVTDINTLLGGLTVQKLTPRGQLNVGYLGGYSFSNQSSQFNSATQEFSIADAWSRGRWSGLIADQLNYTSQSAFYGGITPFDISGLAPAGPIVLQNTFLPGQSIITSYGPRIANGSVVEVNNRISRRTTATLVGNYETLHFLNAGLIDSSSAGFQAGLDYELSRENTVAVAYRFNHLWFNGAAASVADNIFLGEYQRRIGERMVFQIGAGPEVAFIRNSSTTSETHSTWAGQALLRYQLERASVDVSYYHYLSGGSGVFWVAETHLVSVGAGRQFSRLWRGNVLASYGHNTNLLPITNLSTAAPAGATFNTAFGGFELTRRVGKQSELFLGYLARYQISSAPYCTLGPSLACGSNLVGHQFNFGFSWKPNPIPIG